MSRRKQPKIVLPVEVRLEREKQTRRRSQARRAFRIPGTLATSSRTRRLIKQLGKFKKAKKP